MKIQSNQNGRSMIEMLGVLAIIGVLSVGGIAGYTKAMEQYKTNKFLEQLSQIATNTKILYAQQKNYAGLENTTALRSGLIPDDLQKDNLYFYNPWSLTDGHSWIFPVSYKSIGDQQAFLISTRNLPRKICIELATKDWGDPQSSGLLGLVIGSGYISFADDQKVITNCPIDFLRITGGDGNAYTFCPPQLPLSPVKAQTYCNCTETDNECLFALIYH